MFKKLKTVILDQLKQGATPQKLSQSVVVGILVGCFPLLGFTTALAAVMGFYMRLNQIVLQTTNYLMYPVQIILIPVYIKFGTLFIQSDQPISIRPDIIAQEFMASPKDFMQKFIWIGLIAVVLWLVVSLILYFILMKLINPLIGRISKTKSEEII